MASVAKRKWTYKGTQREAWVVRFVDAEGIQRSRQFDRKKDADAFRITIEGDKQRGVRSTAGHRMTLRQLNDDFVRTFDQRLAAGEVGTSHYIALTGMINNHVLPHLGHVPLNDIRMGVLLDWKLVLESNSKLSARYHRRIGRALLTLLNHAEEREWIAGNPARTFMSKFGRVPKVKVRTFTRDEMKKLIETASTRQFRTKHRPQAYMQCFVFLGAVCGLRLGEILGLRLSDLDFDEGVVRVRGSLSVYDGLKATKTPAGIRDVGMPVYLASILRDWLRQYHVPNDLKLVFTYETGLPFNPNNFRAGAWGTLLCRAGLSTDPRRPSFHFHALRHFAASVRVEAGWALPAVARQMGHSSFDMTLGTYTHALDNDVARVAEVQELSRGLMPAPVLLPAT